MRDDFNSFVEWAVTGRMPVPPLIFWVPDILGQVGQAGTGQPGTGRMPVPLNTHAWPLISKIESG